MNQDKKYLMRCKGLLTLLFIFVATLFGCKKFVQVDPPSTKIAGSTVYSGNASASAVLTGIYVNLMGSPTSGLVDGTSSIGFLQALATDELTNYSTTQQTQIQFYTNSLTGSSNGKSNDYYWYQLYNYIYITNAAIQGLSNSTGVTAPMKNQLTGEAKFMRAFLYFYLVNLYGDVPLTTSTDYATNTHLSRTPKAQVYLQIVQDLKEAESLLTNNYLDPNGLTTTARIRPNKGTAQALLARVYLYLGNLSGDASNYTNAAIQADSVINNAQYNLNSNLNQVFKSTSTETIWNLVQTDQAPVNTYDAYYFVLTSPPNGTSSQFVSLSPSLRNAFESGDKRFTSWVGSLTSGGQTYYYPFKYQVYQLNQSKTENIIVFRIAEQYLIRAEAEANGAAGGINAAITDLNTIRQRAGLPVYSGASTQSAVLAAILHERQVELFTEWGHRWFDLIRTKNIDNVMGSSGQNVCAQKGGIWNSNWALLPLPLSELQVNQSLKQNPGY